MLRGSERAAVDWLLFGGQFARATVADRPVADSRFALPDNSYRLKASIRQWPLCCTSARAGQTRSAQYARPADAVAIVEVRPATRP